MTVAVDNFSSSQVGPSGPPTRFGAITPSDVADNELPEVPRCLFVGGGGTVTIKEMDGTTTQLTLPAGQFSMRYRQVLATGTAATGLSWGA